MSLQKQEIPVNLNFGVDTKSDEKLSQKLDILENATFSNGGTISKRPGFLAMGSNIKTGGSIGSGSFLSKFNDELIACDGLSVFSRIDTDSNWSFKGNICPVIPSARVVSSADSFINSDMVLDGGIEIAGHCNFQDRFVSAREISSGNFIVSISSANIFGSMSSAPAVKAFNTGSRCGVVFNGEKALYIVEWDKVNHVFKTPITISFTNYITSFDVTTDGVGLFIVAKSADLLGTNTKLEAIRTDATLAIAAQSTNNYTDLVYICAACFSGGKYYAYFGTIPSINLVDLKFSHYDASMNETYTPTNICTHNDAVGSTYPTTNGLGINVSVLNVSGVMTAFVEYAKDPNAYMQISKFVITASTNHIDTEFFLTVSYGLSTKPWLYNGSVYVNISFDDAAQPCSYTIDASGIVFGKHLFNTSKRFQGRSGYQKAQQEVTLINDSVYFYQGSTSNASYISTTSMVLNFKSTNLTSAQIGDNLIIGGGCLSLYDGVSMTEYGFNTFPKILSITATPQALAVPDGNYDYVAVYEWVDAKGLIHRSAPSPRFNKTLSGGPNSVTITVKALNLTSKISPRDNARIVLYRTDAGGSVLKNLIYVANDPTKYSLNLIDTATTGSASAPIYTTGGVLENSSTPPCEVMTIHKDRVFLIDSEDDMFVLYSKKLSLGESVGFNDFLSIQVQNKDRLTRSAITALSPLDEKLIIFKKDAVLAITGDGPNPQGEQSTFTEVYLVISDTGCINQKSVVQEPSGIHFKSERGIYILQRNLEVNYIGDDVQNYNSLTISGANVIAAKNLVVFTTTTGDAIVWDYYYKQWSTFKNYSCVASIVRNDKLIHMKSNGIINQEQAVFQDNGSAIPIRVVTGWIKFKGVQDFVRAWRMGILGEYKSAHTIQLSAAYDYEKYYDDVYTLTPTGTYNITSKPTDLAIYTGTNDGVYQYNIHLRRQKLQAIKLEILDVPNVDVPGESFGLTNLTFQVGVKSGVAKTPANKRA